MRLTSSDVYFDMYDRDLYASPYAVYRRLRDEAPLYHNEEYRFVAVSRHEDAARVLPCDGPRRRARYEMSSYQLTEIATEGMGKPTETPTLLKSPLAFSPLSAPVIR